MSISKDFGHPLNQNTGNSIQLVNGTRYNVSTSDLAPGSKGRGYLAINETAGGGPFHLTVMQNGKTVVDNPKFVGGNLFIYTVGERVGAYLDLDDGDITFSIVGEKHAPKITSTFDAAK